MMLTWGSSTLGDGLVLPLVLQVIYSDNMTAATAIVLLLLPILTLANIEIDVTASDEAGQQNIIAIGTNEAIISDLEVQTFQLTDENLKNAVKNHFGVKPDDVFVKSPTPWGDLYVLNEWEQVSRILRPVESKVLSVDFKPFLVFSQSFNNTSTKPAVFKAHISQNVEDTVSSVWEKYCEISASKDIKYGFDIKAMGVSGNAAFSYNSKWGESVLKFERVTVGSQTGLDIYLNAGQSVIADLVATRGIMKIQVNYVASLTGTVAVNYADTFKGHHFWSVDVNRVLQAGGLNRTVWSTELIEFAFYVKSRVDLRDVDTNETLMTLSLNVF
ncbi:spherulin-2A-like isoform X2 [Spodoptera litura]|uniref:Spherulin-2A-like isoform X2 n=1 Tax=Spodoptera litura TaxID=69820 RepID=A0A9J7ES30_SPOLT|nr:spherulin-2A-like isoform X2 [Spodoptera litura]